MTTRLLQGVIMFFMGTTHLFATLSREELFSVPPLISAKVSPDGEKIARIGADSTGIPNLFVCSKDDLEAELRQLSFFDAPDIVQFFWSPKSDQVLLLKEDDGTGQHALYGFDVQSAESTLFTEQFPGVTAKVIQLSQSENKGVIGINYRNRHFHDLYQVDFTTGEWTLLVENNTYSQFLVSGDLDLVLKIRINDDGSWSALTADDATFMDLTPEEAFQTEFLSCDQKNVYVLDCRYSDTTQLTRVSLSDPSEREVLGHHEKSDINDVFFIGGEPKGYSSYYTQKEWYPIDSQITDDLVAIKQEVGPNFDIRSTSLDGQIWLIMTNAPDQGTAAWLYERESGQVSNLHRTASERPLAKMYELVVTARDGKELVCYYSLPPEYDKGGYVDQPIPLVVFPHGGPFKVRDWYQFHPCHQWLTSCGYAVLSVNFRLSSGFGKSFVTAGNGEWGGKAHLDVIDAAEACIAKGVAEKGKVAIVGGSYGGYEALAGLTFTPDYFNCSVAICAPSNLKTVLESVPQYWEFTIQPLADRPAFFTKHAFIMSMGGDPSDSEGAAYLEKCSPLNHIDQIKSPLLLIHGKNDHVVVASESQQIYDKMKANGREVSYLRFEDEGHRIAKFHNRMAYLDQIERFLAHHLGGKAHPTEPQLLAQSSGVLHK